jgi:voltage-gated potassium channel
VHSGPKGAFGGQMALNSLRLKAYRQLEPSAWPHNGLSPVNLLLILLIIVAVVEAVMDTEPTVRGGHELMMNNLEFGLGLIFAVEYLARVWVSVENPNCRGWLHPRLRYMLSPIAIIDLLAVLPALFAFGGAPSLILRFFRVLRMLRLAKLGHYSKAWAYIRDALYSRRHEFTIIIGLILMIVLGSGSLLYFAEADAQPEKFGSIPRALWWAVVTLTTVGYGDTYPVTTLGRILAGIIALMGITLIALPTGLFAASFTEAMERQRRRDEDEGPDA